jgi:hypothetical protein
MSVGPAHAWDQDPVIEVGPARPEHLTARDWYCTGWSVGRLDYVRTLLEAAAKLRLAGNAEAADAVSRAIAVSSDCPLADGSALMSATLPGVATREALFREFLAKARGDRKLER